MLGKASEDYPGVITALSDSLFLVTSVNKTEGHFNTRDIILYWVNHKGNVLRTKQIDFSGDDGPGPVLRLENDEFLMLGTSQCDGGDGRNDHVNYDYNRDRVLARFDATGDLKWRWCIGTSGDEGGSAASLFASPLGGYYLAFDYPDDYLNGDITASYGGRDVLLVKVDENGDTEWQRHYGGSGADLLSSASITADGLITIFMRSQSTDHDMANNTGGKKAAMIKTDLEGHIVDCRYFIDPLHDIAFVAPKELPGGDFLLYGYTDSWVSHPGNPDTIKGGYDAVMGYLHADGTLGDLYLFGGSGHDFFLSADIFPNGDIMFAGQSTSTDGDLQGLVPQNVATAWYARVTENGVLKFQDVYTGGSDSVNTGLGETASGVLVFKETEVLGLGTNNTARDRSIYGEHNDAYPPDLRLCRFSFAPTGVDKKTRHHISLHPNPFTNQVLISSAELKKECFMQITDVLGRVVKKQWVVSDNGTLSLDLGSLTEGTYMLHLYLPDEPALVRIVKAEE